MSAAGDSEVQGFYRDCGVLVTGATGFLGKLAIEKILRSCPGVRAVYALVRPKRGLSVDQRKKALLDDAVFDRMKREQPDSVDKIVFVAGDCSSHRLGLSDSDYHHLTQHVHIVLHLAATVRFDEHLKVAVDTNVKGTMGVIALCRDCVSLKVAVVVSTAYSNCPHHVIKEDFYEPPMSVEETLAMVNKFSEYELTVLNPKLIDPWPNSYVFSKAISENVILIQGKGLPIVIVRPSIVFSTIEEPLSGWWGNMYGPISIAVGCGCGILRVSYSKRESLIDIVPADVVVNCIITSTITVHSRSPDVIPVYNITMPEKNPLTVGKFSDIMLKTVREHPYKTAVWYPYLCFVTNMHVYMFLAFFLHFLPGCLLDLVLRLKGKNPIFLKIYKKLKKHSVLTKYFVNCQDWKFISENTRNLYEQLSSQDRKLFPFHLNMINWNGYLEDTVKESRKYVKHESFNVDKAKSHHQRFYIAHILMIAMMYGVVLYVLLAFSNLQWKIH